MAAYDGGATTVEVIGGLAAASGRSASTPAGARVCGVIWRVSGRDFPQALTRPPTRRYGLMCDDGVTEAFRLKSTQCHRRGPG